MRTMACSIFIPSTLLLITSKTHIIGLFPYQTLSGYRINSTGTQSALANELILLLLPVTAPIEQLIVISPTSNRQLFRTRIITSSRKHYSSNTFVGGVVTASILNVKLTGP